MAERRMFAKTIVTSDSFLDMPLSARCLYFTLGMFADDDGFVNNPKSIMRQVGACTDDLNLLLAKRFILSFESGVIVIKHWRIHNLIRLDRYDETKYTEEKSTLYLDERGAYTQSECQAVAMPPTKESGGKPIRLTKGEPTVNQRLPQDRIGEDRIGKDNISFIHSAREDDEEGYIERKVVESGLEGEDAEVYRAEIKENLRLMYINGPLGGGVVMLSQEQFDDLCERLSLDEIKKYIGIARDCELNGKPYKKKTHYQAILDMANKDRSVKKG